MRWDRPSTTRPLVGCPISFVRSTICKYDAIGPRWTFADRLGFDQRCGGIRDPDRSPRISTISPRFPSGRTLGCVPATHEPRPSSAFGQLNYYIYHLTRPLREIPPPTVAAGILGGADLLRRKMTI